MTRKPGPKSEPGVGRGSEPGIGRGSEPNIEESLKNLMASYAARGEEIKVLKRKIALLEQGLARVEEMLQNLLQRLEKAYENEKD